MILDFIVLKDGLPIFTKNVDPHHGITADQGKFTLISGFLSAVSSFADSMEQLGQMQEMQMTSDIYFSFKKAKLQKCILLFIAVSNGETPKHLVKELIQNSTDQFLCQFGEDLSVGWNGNIEIFRRFTDIIDILLQETENKSRIIRAAAQAQVPLSPTNSSRVEDQSIPLESSSATIQTETELKPEISNRFQRYQLMRSFRQQQLQQQEINNGSLKSQINKSNAISGAKVDDDSSFWTTPAAWETKSDLSGLREKQVRDPYSTRILHSQEPTQYISPNGSKYIIHNSSSMAMMQSPSTMVSSRKFRVSLYERIPFIRTRYLADIDTILPTAWHRAIYNAISGQNSIREIANKFRVNPAEIFGVCQELYQRGVLCFEE
jgi:hypothetical protein